MSAATRDITCEEIKTWLDEQREFVLIDVSLAEDYQAAHIPEALNAAVYEVTFLDQVGKLDPLKGSLVNRVLGEGGTNHKEPVVVYGSSERSLASQTAARKLTEAGFSQVFDFRGGLEAWREAGLPTVGTGEPEKSPMTDGPHGIDRESSEFEWTGRSFGGKHSGTLNIASGTVETEDGRLTGGSFTVDMTSMDCTDIDNSDVRKTLHEHLASDDFFDVETFPEAVFEIVSSEEIADAAPSSPNLLVRGRLTLKGVTHPLEFPAVAGVNDEGALTARANFDIDRTKWNVLYGSGKFYEKLGHHLVHDLITIDLKIVAGKVSQVA